MNYEKLTLNVLRYVNILLQLYTYKGRLKSSYDDIISAVDDLFDQWGSSTTTLK